MVWCSANLYIGKSGGGCGGGLPGVVVAIGGVNDSARVYYKRLYLPNFVVPVGTTDDTKKEKKPSTPLLYIRVMHRKRNVSFDCVRIYYNKI